VREKPIKTRSTIDTANQAKKWRSACRRAATGRVVAFVTITIRFCELLAYARGDGRPTDPQTWAGKVVLTSDLLAISITGRRFSLASDQ
jgi:hypothetical protein